MPRGRHDEGAEEGPELGRFPDPWAGADRAGGEPDAEAARLEADRVELAQIEMARIDLAPIDLAALAADDELIDALGSGRVPVEALPAEPVGPDDELVALLAAWVADLSVPPAAGRPADVGPAAVDERADPVVVSHSPPPTGRPTRTPAGSTAAEETDIGPGAVGRRDRTAKPAGTGGPGRHRRRLAAYSTRVAAAAAVVVVATAAVAVGAYEARPGQALWTVTQALYADRASSLAAADEVTRNLEVARTALSEGHTSDAAWAITLVSTRLPEVRPEEGYGDLAAQHQQLL
ncbi:MAG TPA: hypothetical protein VEZ42_10960, partial [Pseudonocardia sp.]|nr:hypothetical protein [Pseudonocardia sp.]